MTVRTLTSVLGLLVLVNLGSGASCPGDDHPADDSGEPHCDPPSFATDAAETSCLLGEPATVDLTQYLESSGSGTPTYSISEGDLPPGLDLDADTGLIAGTPTELGSFPITVVVTVDCEDGSTLTAELALTLDVIESCPDLIVQPEVSLAFNQGEEDSQAVPIYGGYGDLTCTETGDLPPGLAFDATACSFAGTPTTVGTWHVDVHVEDECPEVQVLDIDVELVVAEPSAAPPPGVYTCALTAEEALWVESEIDFGGLQAPYLVGAGSNNWGIFNLGQPYFATLEGSYLNAFQPAWGACPLAGGSDGTRDFAAKAVFSFGPNGAGLTRWSAQDDDFGFTQLVVLSGAVLDGAPFDGRGASGGLSYVVAATHRVEFLEYDAGSTDFIGAPAIPMSSLPGGGSPRSACARAGGSVLIVTDGSPGKLFLHDRVNPSAAATPVGDLGNQPLRVRAAGGIVAVSNFADDTISLGTWSVADVATLTDLATVGDGPFGLDLLDLGDGTVAVASCGFNDDTVSVTVVGSDGMEISTTTQPLPAGVEDPGHVAWLRDGSRRLVIGGNGTSNLAVVDSGL